MAAPTEQQVIQIISEEAQKYGIPPQVLLAVAQVESGINTNSVGQGSYGAFQEQQGGELTAYSNNSIAEAENPQHAAQVAAETISAAAKKYPNMTWGQIAAEAQRPKNASAYAQAVNQLLGAAGDMPSTRATSTTIPNNAPIQAVLMSRVKKGNTGVTKGNTGAAVNALNGGGSSKPSTGATPGPATAGNSGSVGTITIPGGAAPSATGDLLGLSTSNEDALLVGNNNDLLGPDTNSGGAPRTLLQAAESLKSASPTAIMALQAKLYAAGKLTGTIHWGVVDQATVDAFDAIAKSSITNGVSISQQLANEDSTGIFATGKPSATSPTVSVTLSDPTQIALAAQNEAATYGVTLTQKQINAFVTQYQNLEKSAGLSSATAQKDNQKVQQLNALQQLAGQSIPLNETGSPAQEEQALNLTKLLSGNLGTVTDFVQKPDLTSEATAYVEGIAAKTPGAQTKAEASTNADVTKAASAMGVTLSPTQLQNIISQVDANTKATGSPDVNLLNQLVARQFNMPTDPSQLSGDAATVYNDLTKLAGQYLIPTNAVTLGNWVTKAIRNQSYAGSLTGDTEAEFEQYLRQQAAIQYPWLAKATQNFETSNPWDATSSYRTQISNVLGLGDPNSVDLTSAKFSPLLKPDANGNGPTLGEIDQQLLTNPTYGYDQSPNGIARGYSIGISLAKSLGVNLSGV